MFIYKKKLNNNAVIVEDEQQKEKICIGCGLGFQMEKGMVVPEEKIEKLFTLNEDIQSGLVELLEHIPIEFVSLSMSIIDYAKIRISTSIHDSVMIALCDHIHMAVKRKQEGIDVVNVMLWDIKRFYRDEFEVGLHALKLIEEEFGVSLKEDEAGFIALHIVNAQLDLKQKTIKEVTVLMQEIEKIIRVHFSIDMNMDSIYYYRFITHLKFFAERLFSGCDVQKREGDGLLEVIMQKYADAYACVMKIRAFIQKKYHYLLNDEEILYLSIHVARMISTSR